MQGQWKLSKLGQANFAKERYFGKELAMKCLLKYNLILNAKFGQIWFATLQCHIVIIIPTYLAQVIYNQVQPLQISYLAI